MKLFNKYKFSDKRQSLGGIISTIMGLLALASLIYGVYLSYKAEGYAGLKVGSLGLLSLLFSIIGSVIGLLSFKEDDKFYYQRWAHCYVEYSQYLWQRYSLWV